MHPSRNTSHRRGSFFGSFPAAGLAAKEHVKGSTGDEVNSVLARVLGDQARDKKERAAARRRQASSDALLLVPAEENGEDGEDDEREAKEAAQHGNDHYRRVQRGSFLYVKHRSGKVCVFV